MTLVKSINNQRMLTLVSGVVQDCVGNGRGIATCVTDFSDEVDELIDFAGDYFSDRDPTDCNEDGARYWRVSRWMKRRKIHQTAMELDLALGRQVSEELGMPVSSRGYVYNYHPAGAEGFKHQDRGDDITVMFSRGTTIIKSAANKEMFEAGQQFEEAYFATSGVAVVLGNKRLILPARGPAPYHQFSEASGQFERESLGFIYAR